MKLQVIVTKETPDAMAYARALERRRATMDRTRDELRAFLAEAKEWIE